MKELKDLKMKSKAELGKLSSDSLLTEIKDSEKNLYTLRMKLATWEQKQTHIIKVLRRYVASLKTLLQSAK